MKKRHHQTVSSLQIKAKILTLGDLIAATYVERGRLGASAILQLAMKANLIRLARQQSTPW
jgi:hypothetical protein